MKRMIEDIMRSNTRQLHPREMEEDCGELEDTYAEALKDNAGTDILNDLWRKIREFRNELSGRKR